MDSKHIIVLDEGGDGGGLLCRSVERSKGLIVVNGRYLETVLKNFRCLSCTEHAYYIFCICTLGFCNIVSQWWGREG